MNHLTEEQLIEYRLGLPAVAGLPAGAGSAAERARGAIAEHLRACAACRASDEAIARVLAAVDAAPVPERDAFYGARVWRQIESRLGTTPRRVWNWDAWLARRGGLARWSGLAPRRWAAAGALAAVIVAAFVAGHLIWPRGEAPVQIMGAAIPQQAKEGILLLAVGDHLDRTQMVLLEIANADGEAGGGPVDISGEQKRAQELVDSNRLYRQTAAHSGDRAVASLLDELEPVLMEIAHSPDMMSQSDLDSLRKRIEARGLLFKVRVMDSDVREREDKALYKNNNETAPASGRS